MYIVHTSNLFSTYILNLVRNTSKYISPDLSPYKLCTLASIKMIVSKHHGTILSSSQFFLIAKNILPLCCLRCAVMGSQNIS